MLRLIAAACLAAFAMGASAQTIKAHVAPSAPAKPAYRPPQPYNSAAKDTTPFNCEQWRRHPHPGMVGFCESIEYMVLSSEAQRQGRPAASRSVVTLPAMGSAEAKELGYACIGGQAFRRIPNGWEQVSARDGGWQRCTGG